MDTTKPTNTTTEISKSNSKTIGTHSGSFHCDEALACSLLVNHVEMFKNAQIIRSRDPKVLDACDALVDVGSVYSPEQFRYDHHQRSFQDSFGHGFKSRLSSAGLVYKHYGKQIIRDILELPDDSSDTETQSLVNLLYVKQYEVFVHALDCNDNGISRYGNVKAHYRESTNLPSRISGLNPSWNVENVTDEYRFSQFEKAMGITLFEFADSLTYLHSSWLPARKITFDSIIGSKSNSPDSRIIILKQFCPWRSHIYDFEKEHNQVGHFLYVIFSDSSGKWRIQAVSEENDRFKSRLPLPEPWRGIRGEELDGISGISDCVFCHATGFIGGHSSYKGALEMATKSLKLHEANSK